VRGVHGKGVWGSGNLSAAGDAQSGEGVLRRITTDATVTRLTADGAAPGAANIFNIPNNSAFVLRVTMNAYQTGGSAGTIGDCAYSENIIYLRRLTGAAQISVIAAPGGAGGIAQAMSSFIAATSAWRVTLDADLTNGGLGVSGTGEVNKTIRWVARVSSIEVSA
jgi:hypothetical protein